MPQVAKKTTSEVYLQKAILKDYRTIKKLEVEFLPGLNVIIGKNGTGKTNLMEYLYRALNFSNKRYLLNGVLVLTKTSSQEAPLNISHKSHFRNNAGNDIEEFSLDYNASVEITVGEERFEEDNSKIRLSKFLDQKGYLYNSTLISHGVPQKFYFFNESFNYTTTQEDWSKTFSYALSIESPLFVKIILGKIILISNKEAGEEVEIKKIIRDSFNSLKKLKEPLKLFSIIEDIRLSNKYDVYFDTTRKEYVIQNLVIEFKVTNQWLPFNSLSDGTKRVIYIAAEVLAEDGYYFIHNSIIWSSAPSNRIILLEEPELGLHPHQLADLMNFLKEQAKHKQIIISTHSPIVLDSIDPYELDRIQIAELTPEGTQLRRLTPEQQKKAQIFADTTGLLSDYWRFSDLEA